MDEAAEDPYAELARRPPSPCVGVCTLDDDEICIGCHRHVSEIQRWPFMSADEQWEVVRALPERARERGD
ncbi:MAG TPA: DUF1289 domain-containing protein [Gammaproteobacteria bacterium]|nr:DUF1289 domain-containing protein [Gammaproteobacteria bacterium]